MDRARTQASTDELEVLRQEIAELRAETHAFGISSALGPETTRSRLGSDSNRRPALYEGGQPNLTPSRCVPRRASFAAERGRAILKVRRLGTRRDGLGPELLG